MQNRNGNNGGGVLLAVKHTIPCKLVHKGIVGGCEFVIVDVQYHENTYIRYVLVYRPPDTGLDDSIELYRIIFTICKNMFNCSCY